MKKAIREALYPNNSITKGPLKFLMPSRGFVVDRCLTLRQAVGIVVVRLLHRSASPVSHICITLKLGN
jgi:hypothetical protein